MSSFLYNKTLDDAVEKEECVVIVDKDVDVKDILQRNTSFYEYLKDLDDNNLNDCKLDGYSIRSIDYWILKKNT